MAEASYLYLTISVTLAPQAALERALVMIRLVRFKMREPHRHSAILAARVLNIRRVGNVVRLLHGDSPLHFSRRERYSVSQPPAPTDRALAGDDASVGLSTDRVH